MVESIVIKYMVTIVQFRNQIQCLECCDKTAGAEQAHEEGVVSFHFGSLLDTDGVRRCSRMHVSRRAIGPCNGGRRRQRRLPSIFMVLTSEALKGRPPSPSTALQWPSTYTGEQTPLGNGSRSGSRSPAVRPAARSRCRPLGGPARTSASPCVLAIFGLLDRTWTTLRRTLRPKWQRQILSPLPGA